MATYKTEAAFNRIFEIKEFFRASVCNVLLFSFFFMENALMSWAFDFYAIARCQLKINRNENLFEKKLQPKLNEIGMNRKKKKKWNVNGLKIGFKPPRMKAKILRVHWNGNKKNICNPETVINILRAHTSTFFFSFQSILRSCSVSLWQFFLEYFRSKAMFSVCDM